MVFRDRIIDIAKLIDPRDKFIFSADKRDKKRPGDYYDLDIPLGPERSNRNYTLYRIMRSGERSELRTTFEERSHRA